MTARHEVPFGPVPPIEDAALRAARRFLDAFAARCAVRDADLSGSRARGTRRLDSDTDVAVVLRDAKGDRGAAIFDVAGVAFDVMMDTDVLVEATPLRGEEFDAAEGGLTRYLVHDTRCGGVRL